MARKITRPPKPSRRSGGIGRAPGPIGRPVRAASLDLPAYEDVVIPRPRARRAARLPAFIEDVPVGRGPGRLPARPPRGVGKRRPRGY